MVKTFGLENLPEGGFLLLPNNLTGLDAVVLQNACSRPIRFIVNESISHRMALFPLDGCDPDAKRVGGSSCAGGCRPHLPRQDRLHLPGSRTQPIGDAYLALPWVLTSRKIIRNQLFRFGWTGSRGRVSHLKEKNISSKDQIGSRRRSQLSPLGNRFLERIGICAWSTVLQRLSAW
jgi:hypothetical protein